MQLIVGCGNCDYEHELEAGEDIKAYHNKPCPYCGKVLVNDAVYNSYVSFNNMLELLEARGVSINWSGQENNPAIQIYKCRDD